MLFAFETMSINGKMFSKLLKLNFLLTVAGMLQSGIFTWGVANDTNVYRFIKYLQNI